MKRSAFFVTLLFCLFCPDFSESFAGVDPVHDDIVIYRSTESSRGSRYREAGTAPGIRERSSEKRRSYIVLNMSTGEYREVRYFTYDFGRVDGRRVIEKRYSFDSSDITPASLFETDPGEKKNYLILSLEGTGGDFNYKYNSNPGGLNISTSSETMEGRVKLQKIRTDAGVVECLAPSSIGGKTSFEYENTPSDTGVRFRGLSTGKRSLRFDKRLTRDALDAGAHTLESVVGIVTDFLETKDYEAE